MCIAMLSMNFLQLFSLPRSRVRFPLFCLLGGMLKYYSLLRLIIYCFAVGQLLFKQLWSILLYWNRYDEELKRMGPSVRISVCNSTKISCFSFIVKSRIIIHVSGEKGQFYEKMSDNFKSNVLSFFQLIFFKKRGFAFSSK